MGRELVVFTFSAPWCGPCRQFSPQLSGLATKYSGQVDFATVDIENVPTVATNIAELPTILVFKNGSRVNY